MSLHTASSWANLQAAFNAATEDGAEVFMDFATGDGTTQCSWNAPSNAILRGRGYIYGEDLSERGGGDLTVITDNFTSSSPVLSISTNVTGTFRMYGFTVQTGAGDSNIKNSGVVQISGSSAKFRCDHVRLDGTTGTFAAGTHPIFMQFFGYVRGVIDHCIFDPAGIQNPWKTKFDGIDSYGEGDLAWASDTAFGTQDFLVCEDCTYNDHSDLTKSATLAANDCDHGGKYVARFNTLPYSGFQTHPLGGSGGSRGCRAWEIYCNNASPAVPDPDHANFNSNFLSSGTGLIFLNQSVGTAQKFVTFHSDRRYGRFDSGFNGNGTYNQSAPSFGGLGYSGPAYQTSVVNTVSNGAGGMTVTWVSGTHFSTSWPANSMVIINQSSYQISSVASTTSLTVWFPDGGTMTGVTMEVGSNLDGNTDVNTGYPCCDQPGRGKGDLLAGNYDDVGHTPGTKYNSARGANTAASGPLTSLFWPRQALEPVYEFNNTWSCPSCSHTAFWSNYNPDVLVSNQDYYLMGDETTGSPVGTCTSGGSCTAGVGSGTTLPTTCTTGVGFWKTNEGTWNDGSNAIYTGQGRLYKCTSTNTWTFYYEPLAYPHPLVSGSGTTTVAAFPHGHTHPSHGPRGGKVRMT